jgi:prepilin-type N-terminal cleavage/methylation domain-containing protein
MKRRGFTLAEVMVAILFVSIAMFGYISLHMRIIHSSTTLHLRHSIRRKVDLHSALVVGRGRAGQLPADGVNPLFVDSVTQEFLTPYLAASGDNPENNYDGNITIQTQPDAPSIKHLTVEIAWTNRHGPQSYVVDTYTGSKDKGW